MTAKEYLNKYRHMADEIKLKEEQLERLKSQREYISPRAEATSGSGASDKVSNLTAVIMELEEKLEIRIADLAYMRSDIERQIADIEDDRYRLILEARYINGLQWDELIERLHFNDRNWVFKLHGRALQFINPP